MAPKKQRGEKRSTEPAAGAVEVDTDTAFPRGGADLLTPLDRKRIEQAAAAALDAEEAEAGGVRQAHDSDQTGPQKRKRSTGQASKGADGDDVEAGAHFLGQREGPGSAQQRFVQLLNFQRLTVGMRLLGIVLDVSPQRLTISLPHGLRGHVAPEEASDVLAQMLDPASKAGAAVRAARGDEPVPSLPQLFYAGQYVRCEVIGLGPGQGGEDATGASKRVALSLRLKRVCAGRDASAVRQGAALPAVVRGAEDHGFTLELGIKGVKGFLPRTDLEAAHGQGADLLPGALLDVLVTGKPDSRGIARVNVDPTGLAAALAGEADQLALNTLLPGTLVNTKVSLVMRDGLQVKLLGVMTATVDPFHLGPGGQTNAKAFKQDTKLKARVLYVDPNTKEVALSLLPHIINRTMPSPVPMLGQVFEAAAITRVDQGLGLMLALPLGGELGGSCPAYCHISNVSDERVAQLSKSFKPAGLFKCRVIGFRPVDGLATVSGKTEALEQQVVSYRDLQPGQLMSAKVVRTDVDAGLVVEVAPHIRALVPIIHMSDLGKEAAKKKFKVGQMVQGRVWQVDAEAKKMVMTLKPALLGSKLPPLVALAEAAPGTKAHGVVTGVKGHGVFVSFYSGLCGLAPTAELGLASATAKPESVFSIGQVVRARVMSSHPISGKLKLSLRSGKGAEAAPTATVGSDADPFAGLQPGDIVTGRVTGMHDGSALAAGAAPGASLGRHGLQLEVWREGGSEGKSRARLELPGHLADHPRAAQTLLPLLSQIGAIIGPLVVLERQEGSRSLLVSRKQSLVAAARANRLPTSLTQVREGSVVPGYVAGVTSDAVFVRFAGHVTGRAGLSQLADTFVTDPQTLFTEGQSVRAQVVTVDVEKQRFNVSLRPSLTASTDASYAASLFSDLEAAAHIKAAKEGAAEASTEGARLSSGMAIKAVVHDHQDYGLVMDIKGHEDLVGVLRPHHLPGPQGAAPLALGTALACRVLDATELEGILDLTAHPDLVKGATSQKKSLEGLKPGMAVDAKIELVREAPANTLVLSLPGHGHALAHAASTDFNAAVPAAVRRQLGVGDVVRATVQVLPCAATGHRLLVAVDLTVKDGPKESKGSKEGAKLVTGSVVAATVSAVHAAYADVQVNGRVAARLHISEMRDLPAPTVLHQAQSTVLAPGSGSSSKKAGKAKAQDPAAAVVAQGTLLSDLKVGQSLQVVVLPRLKVKPGQGAHQHSQLDVSMRPSVLAAAAAQQAPPAGQAWGNLACGQLLAGVVSEVLEDHLWISLSPSVRGRLNALDASTEPSILVTFATHFKVGQPLAARVARVEPTQHTLDFSLLPSDTFVSAASLVHACMSKPGTSSVAAEAVTTLLQPGKQVMGKVAGVKGQAGLRVYLGGRLYAKVGMTDICDHWVLNALEGVCEGSFVRAVVLSVDSTSLQAGLPRVQLCLRSSKGGALSAGGASASTTATSAPELLAATPTVGTVAKGYVKRSDAKGVFVALDRKTDARIKLCNLSDGFVEDPAAAFPEGMCVEGKVLAATGDKLELSLRSATGANPKWRSASDLKEEEILGGRVRRVEGYGVFVDLTGCNVVGLAHISELAEGKVKDIHALFRPGQTVQAKVLSVNAETGKVSLSLKPANLEGQAAGDNEEGQAAKKQKRSQPSDMDEEMAEAEEGAAAMEGQEDDSESKGGSDDEAIDDMEPEEVDTGSDDAAMMALDTDEDDNDSQDGSAGEDQEEGIDSDVEAEEEEEEDEETGAAQAGASLRQRLASAAPAAGGLLVQEEQVVDADEPEEAAAKAKLSKATKKKVQQDKEQSIREIEMARSKGEDVPQTPADFERSVLSTPNSSYAWIRYMAFLLGLGDVEKGRLLAQRALDTIHYRDEGEKFNVWVAWMNLESSFGTPLPADALMTLFSRALQYCEPKKLYFALLGILSRGGHKELEASTLKAMTKKFGGSAKVWLRQVETCLATGDGDGARKALERAVATLPVRKHIKVITGAAMLEFRQGSAERGRGVMEGVLRNYPKRLDLWSVYIDQEVKLGDASRIRALFERATSLTLPPKKMKFLFKRWLEWEKAQPEHEQAVAHVKQRAMEYVHVASQA